MADIKEVKHHCVFCKEPILPEEKTGYAEGNNPEPLVPYSKGRSCKQCTETGVAAARFAEIAAYGKINEFKKRSKVAMDAGNKAAVVKEYDALIQQEKDRLNQYYKAVTMSLWIEAKQRREREGKK